MKLNCYKLLRNIRHSIVTIFYLLMSQTVSQSDCKILTEDEEMKKGHNMIKPTLYYDMCVQDSCSRTHPDVDYSTVCYAIISYAYDCANEGIFIDVTKFKQCSKLFMVFKSSL